MSNNKETKRKLFTNAVDLSPYVVMTDDEIDRMLVDMERIDRENMVKNHISVESVYANAPF